MTVEVSPAFIQANTYSAEIARRALYLGLARGSSIGSVLGGISAPTDAQITAGTALHIEISPGEVIVPGSSSATQSGYYLRVSSTETLSIAAADPTNPRIDRVSAIIKDKAYTGAEDTGTLAIQTGTPTSGATLTNLTGVAAAPTSSLTLGYVLVPSKATSLEAADIANRAGLLVGRVPANLIWKARSGSYNAEPGELGFQEATSKTVTLPSATIPNQIVGVYAFAGECKIVTTGGAKIYGDFINSVTEIVLQNLQHVTLQSDGTHWLIIAGEPERQQTYAAAKALTKVELEAGVEFSTTRPALLSIEGGGGTWEVGGVKIAANTTCFFVPPGQKLKGSSKALEASVILL